MVPHDEAAMAGLDDIVEKDSPSTTDMKARADIHKPAPAHDGSHHHHHHRQSFDSSTTVPAPAPPSPHLSTKDHPCQHHTPPGDGYSIVGFTPSDPGNPKNWSKAYKWYCTLVVALTCFVVAFASSVITADVAGVVEEFGVSEEVALVSISVFVVGFGVGPMVFAPLSEVYGRRVI